jgi:hypothetical protein
MRCDERCCISTFEGVFFFLSLNTAASPILLHHYIYPLHHYLVL